MCNDIHMVIDNLQNELRKTNIEDFYIIRYDRSGRLILAGSFDFGYYHDVEIIFYDVLFICCPTSTFTINKLRLANESEIKKLNEIMNGVEIEDKVICMEDTFSNIRYFIVSSDFKYYFQKVNYFKEGRLIKDEVISDWAREKLDMI